MGKINGIKIKNSPWEGVGVKNELKKGTDRLIDDRKQSQTKPFFKYWFSVG